MTFLGKLEKMKATLGSSVLYQLPVGDELVGLNEAIGHPISLRYQNQINCIHCGRKTNKSFNQGYCYPCFKSLAQCDMCIVKPETCHYHAGTCREPEWAEQHCLQHHYVYLANSSGLKVGITRGSQIPTRWMDQGANSAVPIFKTRDRLVSGQLEVILKQHVADRTDWRKMLKGEPEVIDLIQRRDSLVDVARAEINALEKELGSDAFAFLDDESPIAIQYPVQQYPEKIKALNFDKTAEVSGVLNGIKGQYLILDTGVLNIRKFGGYVVQVAIA